MADQQKRQWGVTNPISEAQPTEADLKLNDQLVDYLKAKNNFESPEATDRRRKVLAHIQKVAEEFIKRAGRAKNLPQSTVESLGGKVFTYGSFSLGVYGPTSDIDTLIVAPKHVVISDFFAIFPQTFKEMTDMSEVDEFVPVEDAYVPIIKMEYRQVSIDLIFASLPTQSTIPRTFELVGDIQVLRGLDEAEMRSVNGPRVTKELLENIPQPKSFRYALRAIKLWSNQRGIYGAVFGYPGGIAWAIMVARISQLYPYACGATIVSKFFNLMRKWHWPRPVMLKDVGHTVDNRNPLNLRYWNPQIYGGDRAHIMPVVTPAYPQMCATHSITHSTFDVMMHEFERADEIMASVQAGRKTWDDLFVRHTFFTEDHKYYLSVVATSTTKDAHEVFKGIVQSKVRLLSKYIEEGDGGVDCARPFMKATERMHRVTTEDQMEKVRKGNVDYQIKSDEVPKDADPSSNGDGPKIFHTATFYIGLTLSEAGTKSLDISWPVSEFRRLVMEAARYDTETMDLRVVHTRNTHLPADVFVEGETRPMKPAKDKKKKANGTKADGSSKASKRHFAETGMEDSEKTSKKRISEANGIQAAVPA